MPRYIVYQSVNDGCDTTIDRNSAVFFNNLATKLLAMSKAIQTKMDDLANKVCSPNEYGGFVLVSIDTPQMLLGVKYEYIEYIKRYGPPIKGQFNENLLDKLRKELNISTMDTNF